MRGSGEMEFSRATLGHIQHRPLPHILPASCLCRIHTGPKEGAVALTWHPLRSMLLSVSGTGRVLCWARIYAENWSAFAPDFLELDENLEYAEREDEFDWNTPVRLAVCVCLSV